MPSHTIEQRIPTVRAQMFCVCGHEHGHHNMLDMTDCSIVGCDCKQWGLDDMSGRTTPRTDEPAVVRIARAMQALAAAIPGAHMIAVSPEVNKRAITINADTDEDVRSIAASLGIRANEKAFEGHRWISAVYFADDLHIAITGPHHEIVAPPAIDSAAVTAALALAKAAL